MPQESDTRIEVRLRAVVDADLDHFFAHQRDADAARMAAFVSRDEPSFREKWAQIRADPKVVVRTVLAGDEVVGHAVAWPEDSGRWLVGYWVDRERWGKGIATAALAQLVELVPQRPLYAEVAQANVGSVRVLEKCGFRAIGSEVQFDEALGQIVELLFALQEPRLMHRA